MAITDEVLAEIKEKATHLYEYMRESYIDAQIRGYQRIEELDSEGVPQEVVESIKERCLRADNYWRFSASAECIEKDIAGYRFLLNYSNSRIPSDRISEIKEEAARIYPHQYFSQRCRFESLVEGEIRNIATRSHVDPIKSLLIELEGLIGSECWIDNANSYDQYDYPLTLPVGAEESRLDRPVSKSIRAEQLLASYYKFGKNQLHIFNGLLKVVEYLQARYGLDLTKESDR